jgi:hypothetical protein
VKDAPTNRLVTATGERPYMSFQSPLRHTCGPRLTLDSRPLRSACWGALRTEGKPPTEYPTEAKCECIDEQPDANSQPAPWR